MKAIRLVFHAQLNIDATELDYWYSLSYLFGCCFIFQVANKLYPLSSVAQQIEDFANEMLLSVINGAHATDRTETEGSSTELQKVFTLCFHKICVTTLPSLLPFARKWQ